MPVPAFVQVRLLAIFVETFAIFACLFSCLHVSEEVLLPLLLDPGSCSSAFEDALVLLSVDVERFIFCRCDFFLDYLSRRFRLCIDDIVVVNRDAETEVGRTGVESIEAW